MKNVDIYSLTKKSKFKIKTNPYEFPISVNQLDSNEACETLGALRSIFTSRMIFGTAEADKPDGVWQKQKFKEEILKKYFIIFLMNVVSKKKSLSSLFKVILGQKLKNA